MKTLIAIIFFAFAFCRANLPCPASDLPNIIIVYADDMGYGDLGVQNADSKIPTPNLDELAKQGLRFTDAHSSSGICTPSRYALLTGRYHWRKLYGIPPLWGSSVIADERLTLPEMLKDRGYNTGCIGKWHLGLNWSEIRKPTATPIIVNKAKTWPADAFDWSKPVPGGPLSHGFDYYFGDDVPNFPPYTWIENDRVLEPPTEPFEPSPLPTEGSAESRPGPMAAGWKQDAVMPELAQRAVAWIEQQAQQDSPFFLYWAWTSPHAPIVPTAEWQGSTQAGGYGDYLAQSDYHLGQLMQALKEQGLDDNTLIVFSSDNGPERYAFDRFKNSDHRSSGELRGVKRDIWEGGHRVPCIVRWPGTVEAGSVTDGLMSQIDIMATLAKVVGFDLPPTSAEDSVNQLPLWKGGTTARSSLVHNTKKNHFAIRKDQWVLIDAPSGQITGTPNWYNQQFGYQKYSERPILFDLSKDLGQRVNLSGKHPELVKQMKAELSAIQSSGEVR